MQIKMALEQGNWMENSIFGSFLVMGEMQL